jgi:hypothetical protein
VRDASRHAYPARCGPRQPRGTHPTTLPGGRLLGRSTPRRRPEPRARGGLTRPGGRSPRRSPWCPGYASPVACGAPRLHRRNPREEWWGRPSAAGTSTLPETPSFAWRTNASLQLLPEAGAQRRLEAVSCKALFGPDLSPRPALARRAGHRTPAVTGRRQTMSVQVK